MLHSIRVAPRDTHDVVSVTRATGDLRIGSELSRGKPQLSATRENESVNANGHAREAPYSEYGTLRTTICQEAILAPSRNTFAACS